MYYTHSIITILHFHLNNQYAFEFDALFHHFLNIRFQILYNIMSALE